MAKITFLPVGATLDVKPGTSILDVAIDNDMPLQHACGGFCACTTCHVYVREGAQNLSPMDEDEKERLASKDGAESFSRLSCQTKILGDCTVEIVDPA